MGVWGMRVSELGQYILNKIVNKSAYVKIF